MSIVKERIIGAVTIMNEKDAEKIWNIMQSLYNLSNAEEDVPYIEELEILEKYHNGEPDHQPSISHEDLIKELGL